MPRIKLDDVKPSVSSGKRSGLAPENVVSSTAPVEKEAMMGESGRVSVEPNPAVVEVAPTQTTNNSTTDAGLAGKSGTGWLSAFLVDPQEVSFGEAEPGEKILLLLRAHLVTLLPSGLVVLALLIAPLFLFPFLSTFGSLGMSGGTMFVAILFWYLGTVTYAFLNFLYWYFNVYLVTNARIIDTDWYSVVVRKVSSTSIAKIQDVSASQVGVLSGIFDYGDVEIQTAGEDDNFEFVAVPNPQLVAKEINKLMQKEGQGGNDGT